MSELNKYLQEQNIATTLGGGSGGFGADASASPGPFETFGKSFLWGLGPGMIGVDEPQALASAQDENPIAGFMGDFAGMLVPYAGWAKIAGKSTMMAKALSKVASAEKVVESPFKALAAREIVRFAPFEIGRIGASALAADPVAEAFDTTAGGPGEVAGQAALNLALGGVVAGGIGKYISAGRARKKGQPKIDEIPVGDSNQDKLEKIATRLSRGNFADEAEQWIAQSKAQGLARKIRSETPKKGTVFVEELLDGEDARAVNRLFQEKSTPNLVRKRLQVSAKKSGPFKTHADIEALAKEAGIHTGKYWEQNVKYPRYIEASGTGAPKHIQRTLKENMTSVDSAGGWAISRDRGDGMFIMSKKLERDRWLLFKTDKPELYLPEQSKYADGIMKQMRIWDEVPVPKTLGEGAEVFDTGSEFYSKIPLIDTTGMDVRAGKGVQVTRALLKSLGHEGDALPGSEMFDRVHKFGQKYLYPSMFQAKQHPILGRSLAVAGSMRDRAQGLAEEIFLGPRAVGTRKTLFGEVFKDLPKGAHGGVKDLIDQVYKDLDQVQAVWRTVISGRSIENGIEEFGLKKAGIDLLSKLQKVDEWQMAGLKKIQKASKVDAPILPKPFHYMLSRTWKGDHRIPILARDPGGRVKLYGYASGKTIPQAQKHAEELVAVAKASGADVTKGKNFLVGEVDDELKKMVGIKTEQAEIFGKWQDDLYMKKGGPVRAKKKRTGAAGFTGELRPWDKADLEHIVFKQLQDYQMYNARLSSSALLKNDLDALRGIDEQLFEIGTDRINSMFGTRGEFSKGVNKIVDSVMSPVLGKNSADKITSTMNKYMFRWTLGFWNTGYNIANMLTFVQTAFPHMAYLTSVPPSAASKYYTFWPVAGKKSANAMGVLDMFKVARKSFAEMGNPDELLKKQFARAGVEGVWDPRYVEEFVGKQASGRLNFAKVLKGDEPMSEWLGAVADFLPGKTEKFSRGHSFAMGHIFFRDVMGITDDEMLYQLTKQFVEKTQFLYSTSDRAKVITGPIGSSFGLFKNWLMHYMGWMSEYTGEAVLKGNWKPLLWSMGGTAAIGGVGAAGPATWAANEMSEWLTDETLMQNTYDMFGDANREDFGGGMSDAVYYGLPAFLGFTIQNQVSMPFTDPGADASHLMGFAYLDRMKYAGKAFGQAIDHWNATGEHPGNDKRTLELMMRAFAPKSVYRTAQAIQGESLKSLNTGAPITDMTLGESIYYGAGLDPKWIASRFDVARELRLDQEKRKTAISSAGRAWASAVEEKDWTGAQRIVIGAAAENIDVSSVLKSGKAFLAKGSEDMIERRYKAENIWNYAKYGLVD